MLNLDNPSYSGLERFIHSWQAFKSPKKSSLLERLGDFLPAVGPLLKREMASEARQKRPAISPERLKCVMDQLRDPLKRSRQRGDSFNPWAVSGIRFDEVRNTAVLAELMRPSSCGDLAKEFVFEFFSRLKPGDFKLPSKQELNKGYSVSREVCPIGQNSERIDLVIEGKTFLVGIEVKINAVEGERQLDRYRHSLKERARRAGDHEPVLIFLTKRRAKGRSDIVAASWRDIADAANRSVPKNRKLWTFNDRLLIAFSQHIKTF